jgi:hypothetical protein
MRDGNGIRGMMVLSRIVMWVIWQWNTWRDGYITYWDVGDMTMDTRDIDMWQRQVEPKMWHIDTWHIDIVKRWVKPKKWHVNMWLIDL